MVSTLKKIKGVKDVHDVHVWSISPELHAMSCHVLVSDLPLSRAGEIRRELEKVLRSQFDIEHSTLQFECRECGTNDLFCSLIPEPGEEKDTEPQD